MRKPEQLLDNEIIKDKILEMIHIYKVDKTIPYNAKNRSELLKQRDKLFEQLLIMMKHFNFCSDGVVSLWFDVYDYDDHKSIYFSESFASSTRTTRIKLYK